MKIVLMISLKLSPHIIHVSGGDILENEQEVNMVKKANNYLKLLSI